MKSNARLNRAVASILGVDPKDRRLALAVRVASLSPQQVGIYMAIDGITRNRDLMKVTKLPRNLIAAQLQAMAKKGVVQHTPEGWRRK
jgi:dihydroxyacid dehydratase/phosphogluconate dehydratase